MVVEYANYLHSRGHNVKIMTAHLQTVFQIKCKIEIFSSSKTKLKTILKALSFRSKSDVLIADIIAMTLFLSFRNHKRLLYFAQDYDESYYRNPLMKFIIRLIYFYCLTILKIPVIAVSEELRILLKSRFSANVTVINNGIDTNIFYPDKDKDYISLKGNSRVVLIFARSDVRKGFDLAVAVLKDVKDQIEKGEISVWAVGENLSTPFSVRHFCFVMPEVLRKILSSVDVLLYPSRHEGLPLFILEAMACGCPIVTTTASNIVKDGFNGLVCHVEDVKCLSEKVKLILSDKDLVNILINNARDTASGFGINTASFLFEERLKRFANG